MRAGQAAALIAAHADQRSNLGGFAAGGCPPAAGGQERPAAMRQESWRGQRPGDPPSHGPARAPRAFAVPPRGPRGKRNQPVHTPLAPRRAVPKCTAARASRPPCGRQEKTKKKKTAATRNRSRAVRRPCAGLSRGRATGGSKCRRRPLDRRGLFPALVESVLPCSVRAIVLQHESLCRSGSPPGSSPLLQTPSIFLSEAMLGPRAGGHMQPATAACVASMHSRVPGMIRLGRQASACRPRRPSGPGPSGSAPCSGRAPLPLDDSGRAALRHSRPTSAPPPHPAGRPGTKELRPPAAGRPHGGRKSRQPSQAAAP